MNTETNANTTKKHLFISDLKPRDVVRTSFLVKHKELLSNKQGKPYLAMLLSDKSGEIDTRVWEGAEELSATFNEGDLVAVGGKTHLFQDRMQLVVSDLIPLPSTDALMDDYLPSTDHDVDALYSDLISIFDKLENPWIREVALKLLQDPEIAARYKLCPAAKTIHHAFIGGLLVHSLQLIKLVDAILPLYVGINRDLMIFGAAFHDFGKIFELKFQGPFGYTDEGKLVGHITIGATLVDRKIQQIPGFPSDIEFHLKHLILSHHGKLEYGSPKRPATLEAEVLHCLDHMDSRIDGIQGFIRADKNPGRWTAYHKPYDQYYWKLETGNWKPE